jgi:hypothetical protein
MAKLKLTELPRATSAGGEDLIYVVQSNASKALAISTLLSNITVDVSNLTSNTQIENFIRENITTSNIAEGINLYYTNHRVSSFITTLNTGNIAEGVNLYYTNARVAAQLSNSLSNSLVSGNGISITGTTISANVQSVAGYTGIVELDTEDITETPNLLFFNTYRGYSLVDLNNKHRLISAGNVGFSVSGYSNTNPDLYVDPGTSLVFELFSFTNPVKILDNEGNLYNSLLHYQNPIVGIASSAGEAAQNKTTGILVIGIPDSLVGKTLTYQGNANASMSGTIHISNPAAIKTTNTTIELRLPPKLPSFTQAEINAIAAEDGMMLLNSTNSKVQVYVSPHWRDIHSDDYRNRY